MQRKMKVFKKEDPTKDGGGKNDAINDQDLKASSKLMFQMFHRFLDSKTEPICYNIGYEIDLSSSAAFFEIDVRL